MFKAGTAQICISPGADPEEVKTYHNPPPAGFYHDVFVKALALRNDNSSPLVIVSMDIILLREDMLTRIREGFKSKLGLEEHQVLLCVSHTHSGPIREEPLKQFGLTVDEYRQIVVDRTISVIEKALNNMAPARAYFGRGTLRISINRRWRNPNGYPVWRGNPYGEVDPELGVLRVDGEDGSVKAVLMNYACHASAIGTSLIGNDYPGFAQEIIENRYPGSTALFAQGCAGEIKPYNVNPNFKFMYGVPPAVVAGIGWEMAKETTRVIEATPMDEITGDINTERVVIELPLEDPPSSEEEIRNVKSIGGEEEAERQWKEFMLSKLKDGTINDLPRSRPYEMGFVRIGERFRLVALQGEPCVRIGLRLKEQITPNTAEISADARNIRNVMVFGYTNHPDKMVGYVPSRDVSAAGGYEAETFLIYKWSGPYKPEIEDIIVQTAIEHLAK